MNPSNPIQVLRAGPLEATLDGASLRWIRWNGVEVLRGLGVTVRDQNWGTIEPAVVDFVRSHRPGRWSAAFIARYPALDPFLEVSVRVSASAAGLLEFSMRGEARRKFLRNRIGIVALHGSQVAGHSARFVRLTSAEKGTFPRQPAPWQVATDITAIEWSPGPGVKAKLALDGELFEMEDQRNWGDASFKTYPTPLRLPYPVAVSAGDLISQSAKIELRGEARRRDASPPDTIRVIDRPRVRLPAIGALLPPHAPEPLEADAARIRQLGLRHLRVFVDIRDPRAAALVEQAARQASDAAALLELDLLATPSDDLLLERLVEVIAEHQRRFAAVFVFDRESSSGFDTTRELASMVRAAFQRRNVRIPLGGGTRANFTELNRAGLGGADIDIVTFAINPQVHAFDEASIVETLEVLPLLAREARAIANGRPLSIVLSLKPRFNATASRDQQGADNRDRIDVRQGSEFAASWLVGAIAALSQSGVERLSCFETIGPAGLLPARTSGSGACEAGSGSGIYAVGAVANVLCSAQAATVLRVVHPSGTAVLAIRRQGHLVVFIANLEPFAKSVRVEVPNAATFDRNALEVPHSTHACGASWRRHPSVAFDGVAPRSLRLEAWGLTRLDER